MPVKAGYLIITGGGAILVWSGLKGKAWTEVLRALISGKKPETTLTAYAVTGTGSTPAGPGLGSPGLAGGSRTKNLAIGKVLAARYGWSTGAEWAALVSLWDSESGWNNRI